MDRLGTDRWTVLLTVPGSATTARNAQTMPTSGPIPRVRSPPRVPRRTARSVRNGLQSPVRAGTYQGRPTPPKESIPLGTCEISGLGPGEGIPGFREGAPEAPRRAASGTRAEADPGPQGPSCVRIRANRRGAARRSWSRSSRAEAACGGASRAPGSRPARPRGVPAAPSSGGSRPGSGVRRVGTPSSGGTGSSGGAGSSGGTGGPART